MIREESIEGYALRNPLGPRPIAIGARTQSSYPSNEPNYTFDGMLDEARVANTVRSDAWIEASYLNQKTVDALLTVGDFEMRPVGMIFVIR